MKDLLIILLGLILVAASAYISLSQASGRRTYDECLVVRVIDGDTLTCAAGLSTPRRIRLMGYDAPDLPGIAGRLARSTLDSLLPEGTRLTLWRLPGDREVDEYGRELWRAYLDISWYMGSVSDRLRATVREEGI